MTHLDGNSAYLANALSGHRGATYPITVISSADTAPGDLGPGIEVIHDRALNTATKKVQAFTKHSKASFFLVQSDDVIVSPNIIARMEEATEACVHPVLMTPFSNNEENSRFYSYAGDWMSHKDKRISDVPSLDLSQVPTTKAVIKVEWFAFYCVYIPRCVLDVLELDEALENRYNDLDVCLRAAKIGIPSLINLGCLAYHYGSVTLNQIVTPEMYAEADAHWANKMQKSGAV